jgi:hypothetical protein
MASVGRSPLYGNAMVLTCVKGKAQIVERSGGRRDGGLAVLGRLEGLFDAFVGNLSDN